MKTTLWFSFNTLNADLDNISFSVVAGGNIVDHVVDFKYNIGYIRERANSFSVEASTNIYSFLRQSKSAFGINGGIYKVALINGLSKFLKNSHYIYYLSIYTSVSQSSPSKRYKNNIGLPLLKDKS